MKVFVLVGDIEEFASSMRRRDESVLDLLRWFISRAQEITERHQGRMFSQREALWSIFREPDQCLLAAQEMLASIRDYNKTRDEGSAFQIRLGASYGELERLPDGDIKGPALDDARRLEDLCPPQSLLLSTEVRNMSREVETELRFRRFVTGRNRGKAIYEAQLPALEKALTVDELSLIDPGLYTLKFVQAAIAAGAGSISWTCERHAVTLRADCPDLSEVRPLRLHRLLTDEVEPARIPDPVERELVLTLQSALELGPQEVDWSVWEGEDGQTLKLQQYYPPELAGMDRIPRDVKRGAEIRWTRHRKSLLDYLAPTLLQSAVTDHRAAERCRFAPIDVRLDGRSVVDPSPDAFNPSGFIEDVVSMDFPKRFSLAERYLIPQFETPHMLAGPAPLSRKALKVQLKSKIVRLPPPPEQRCLWLHLMDVEPSRLPAGTVREQKRVSFPTARRCSDPIQCYAILQIPAHLEGIGRVYFVHSGVTLVQESSDLGCPGAVAIVSAAGLTIDTARFEVVQNDEYYRRLHFLRSQFREMKEALEEHLEHLPDPVVSYARDRLES